MGDDPEPPKPHLYLQIVRRLAAVGAVRFSFHAEGDDQRMHERGFDTQDVMATLRLGELKGDVTPGRNAGEWIGKLICQPYGTRRWMGVVAVVVRGEHLQIVTTEWED